MAKVGQRFPTSGRKVGEAFPADTLEAEPPRRQLPIPGRDIPAIPYGGDNSLSSLILDEYGVKRPTPDEGIEDRGIGPLALLVGGGVGARMERALHPIFQYFVPKAVTRAVSGGIAGGTEGAIDDIAARRNPIPNVPLNVLGGTVAYPTMGVLGDAATKMVRGRPRLEPPVTQPRTRAAAPARQPLTGENRQQFTFMEDVVNEARNDPDYLRRLDELGGGRVVTNNETVARAASLGPMDPTELAAWKAGTAVNEVDVTRGLITLDMLRQRRNQAMLAGDEETVRATNAAIKELLPGVTNLRATPGRATQAQAMFVEDELTRALDELDDMLEGGVPFEQVRRMANERMAQFQNAGRARRLGKGAVDAIRAFETWVTRAKLTSPMTHAYNTVSNALTFLTIRPLDKLGSAAVLQSQGKGKQAAARLATAFGSTQGFKSGFKKYWSTLFDDNPDMGRASEVAARPSRWPRPLRPLDPFRQLAAADGFWKAVIIDSKLNELALASGMERGLRGDDLARYVASQVGAPPRAWLAKAKTESEEFTFQADSDEILKTLSRFQNWPGMKLFIPFVKTPYNIIKMQFQRSPAGVLATRNIKGLAAGGEEQAEAAGRLMTGTILSASAYAMVKSGDVTGDYPKDANERAMWDATGIRPYSIKVGDKWVQYNRFAPLGLYLQQAVAFDEAVTAGDEENAIDIASRMVATSAKGVADMPFVSGFSAIADAITDPEREGSKLASQAVVGMVPTIARDVRYQTDPVQRQVGGISDRLANAIPGMSDDLPPRVDVLGREMRYEENRIGRATKIVTTEDDSEEAKLLRKIGYAPAVPSGRFKKQGRSIKLTGKELEKYRKESGGAVASALRTLMNDPTFLELDRDEQIERIDKLVEKNREPIRIQTRRAAQ